MHAYTDTSMLHYIYWLATAPLLYEYTQVLSLPLCVCTKLANVHGAAHITILLVSGWSGRRM